MDDRLRNGLHEALEDSQRLGMLGARPIDEVIEHSLAFVRALETCTAELGGRPARVVDMGAGGGVPGLVVGAACPDVDLVLVDRRAKRTDHLVRLVRRLEAEGLAARVTVVTADVFELHARAGWAHAADVVLARGFGRPEVTLRAAAGLAREGGWLVVSEPPEGDRWTARLLEVEGFERRWPELRGVAVLQRVSQGTRQA